ncbi:hypothetical protein EBAPG3_009250 [Nitrosospira lacus]|uniref:ATP-grasp domain-containing protein n=1 Tax=Nitrosospira lacus TaxID=1288494 RepID=A0A1W6SQ68_9PROT|nr:hypothetical protein [Nitrosospira lacus]ARO87937.1 hypothetical protein EBAPG3_009250 [Nitrosospira lacus]
MHKLEALLIGGYWPELMMVILALLTRAGFTVDVISTSAFLKKNKSIRNYFLADENDLLVKAASEKIKQEYTLIVVGDDPTLGKILNSDLSDEDKLELLPVLSNKNLGHIFSKIGLARVLDKNGINTPDYLVANNEQELKTSARILGYPIFIKIDSSAGGLGIFECLEGSDLEGLLKKIKIYPVLVQKKITGVEVSVESFYQDGQLIHFAYSIPKKSKYKFGPTSVRNYVQLAFLEKKVFDELGLLGKALGAHGFVNIGCMQSDQDKKLYFFEADMRPNLWIDHPKYFGDDWAKIINRHFSTGETIKYPYPLNSGYPKQILISHYSRMALIDLVLNRHQVWNHLPENFLYLTLHYRIRAQVISIMAKSYRLLLPKWCRVILKNAYHQLNIHFK